MHTHKGFKKRLSRYTSSSKQLPSVFWMFDFNRLRLHCRKGKLFVRLQRAVIVNLCDAKISARMPFRGNRMEAVKESEALTSLPSLPDFISCGRSPAEIAGHFYDVPRPRSSREEAP